MRWPFENDTSAIVRALSKRMLASDRKSAAFLVVTIALAVAMVLATALSSAGLAEKAKDPYRTQAQVTVVGPTESQLSAMRSADGIDWVGEYSALGYSYQDGVSLVLVYGDSDYFSKQTKLAYEGTLPASDDDIMLERGYLEHMGWKVQVGDTVQMDLTGLGETAAYRLSGIVERDSDDSLYTVYVGKPLAQAIADETLGGQLSVTAYTRLATEDISSEGLVSAANAALAPLGIASAQIFLTDYFAAMNGVLGGGLHLSIPLLALVTGILAAVIVYGVFYTMIVKHVQMLGQLRTIGMTTRQIRRIMRRNGRRFAWQGIAMGLVLGTAVSFAVCPTGFRVETALLYGGVSAVIARLAVMAAIWRPVRIAAKISPIEGSRYLSAKSKRCRTQRRHRPLTPARLARIHLGRSRIKTAFTLMTLALSGALFLAVATVAGSIDAEKQARFEYYPSGDIEVMLQSVARSTFEANGEYNYDTRLQVENNPLSDPALTASLLAIDGVEQVTAHEAIRATIEMPWDMGSILSQDSNVPVIDADDFAAIAPLLTAGTPTYETMSADNGILINEHYGSVGDTFSVTVRGVDGAPHTFQATAVGSYDPEVLMAQYSLVPGSPTFLLTADSVRTLTGVTDATGILTVAVAPGAYETVRTQIKQMADASDVIDENDISQTIENINAINGITIRNLYLVAVILFLFGGLSMSNMLLVDLRNRRRDLGLLGAVGATQHQLRRMLLWEIAAILGGAGLVGMLGAAIGGGIACKIINDAHHCIDVAIPWLFLTAYVALLLAIGGMFARCATVQLRYSTPLEAIRSE